MPALDTVNQVLSTESSLLLPLSDLPPATLYRFAIECVEHALRPTTSQDVALPAVEGTEALERALAARRAWLANPSDNGPIDAESSRPGAPNDDQLLRGKTSDLNSLRQALLDPDAESCASATALQCAELYGQRFYNHEGGGYWGVDCALAASLSETCWHYDHLISLRSQRP